MASGFVGGGFVFRVQISPLNGFCSPKRCTDLILPTF